MTVATGIGLHALVDRYGEAWNAHELDLIMSFHAEDGTHCFHADRERAHGTDEIREAFGSYFTEWPDIHFERRVTAHAVNGDYVFISWQANASVGGETVEWVGIDRFRLKGDLADEVYAVFDTFPLREAQDRALGQVPA